MRIESDKNGAAAVAGRSSLLGPATAAIPSVVVVGAVLAVAIAATVLVRVWQLGAVGFNSDEAVYAGQGAAIAGDPELDDFFPIFRAHPLLFQTIVAVGYELGGGDMAARSLAVVFGLATLVITYRLGSLLYGPRAGALAAIFLGLMPYHVLVSRQVLLDGPMVFFATLTLYFCARYAATRQPSWLYAAGASMGLTVLGKETSILLLGAGYAFVALTPELGTRIRDVIIFLGLMFVVVSAFPLALRLAGAASERGQQYLAYQLFRRPNHEWTFYPATVPPAMGVLVILTALAGLWLLRDEVSWRETLLLCWIAVPTLFFQLYPVKGFQYLLPTAPAVVVLASRTLARWSERGALPVGRLQLRAKWIVPALALATALSLAIPTWQRIQPSDDGTFLAGSGGLPYGREAGTWMKENMPVGAEVLAIGPSMANIVQFYGHRRAYGLSVGPNPLKRNPVYKAVPNPDLAIRRNQIQYLVWDAYTAARTTFFSAKLIEYARKYNGRVVHTQAATVRTKDGREIRKPIIVVYAVRR